MCTSLYETWDLMIRHLSSGKYVTNWNVDDRKHPRSLALRVQVLEQKPEVDIVTSAVSVSHEDNAIWSETFKDVW